MGRARACSRACSRPPAPRAARCRSPRAAARTGRRVRGATAPGTPRGPARPATRTPAPPADRPAFARASSLAPVDDELAPAARRLAAHRLPGREHAVKALLGRVRRIGDRRDVALRGHRPRGLDRDWQHERSPPGRLGPGQLRERPLAPGQAAAAPRAAAGARAGAARARGDLDGSPAEGASKRIAPGRGQKQRRGRTRVDDRPRPHPRERLARPLRELRAPRRGPSAISVRVDLRPLRTRDLDARTGPLERALQLLVGDA